MPRSTRRAVVRERHHPATEPDGARRDGQLPGAGRRRAGRPCSRRAIRSWWLRSSTAEVRQQIVVAAAQAYLAVTAAHRQVDVSTRSLESARTHLDYAQKRFEGGAGSRLNQLRAAQIVSTEETRLEAIQFALRTAQEALGVLVVADGPVDSGAEPVFDQTGAMDEDAWRKARPDLITQAAVQRSAERVFRDSWKDWVPDVTASFDPTFITPAGLFQPSRTWRVTFFTTYALFEGGQRKILERQRAITLDQAEADADGTRDSGAVGSAARAGSGPVAHPGARRARGGRPNRPPKSSRSRRRRSKSARRRTSK